jgi:2-methylcitrate dehydratase PrpD
VTVVLLASVIAGYLAGGRIGNLANLHLRGLPLLLGAVCAPLVAAWITGGRAATTGTALGLLLVAGFLGLNVRERRGTLRTALVVMAVGWCLNSVAVLANGGMPSPPEVLAGPESSITTFVGPHAATHTLLDSSTRLPWLADAIVVRPPGYAVSLSIGDLVLAAGVVMFFLTAMRTREVAATDAY